MLRFLALAFLFAAPAHADITSKLQSSVQLQVDGAASQATKIGSTYSVSGSNVKITSDGAFGGLNTLSAGTAVGYTGTDVEINTAGAAFQFTESFIEGDALTFSLLVLLPTGNMRVLLLSLVITIRFVPHRLFGSTK